MTGLHSRLLESNVSLSPQYLNLQLLKLHGSLGIVMSVYKTVIDSIGHSGSWLSRIRQQKSPNSKLGLGRVSSSLFQGGVSASGISALRLVDGAALIWAMDALVRGGQIHGDKKNGSSGGVENVVACSQQLSGSLLKDPQRTIPPHDRASVVNRQL
ncbi:hypothetical protein Tco_0653979 [Tanacetum coccineum]|uniref:Uncharacterized protein n=1 Tax=Tanacetum coccineum TaxID=301880 RepID=A0ABQ4X2F9_9ASTR